MLSPTVLRFAAIGSIAGIIAMAFNGFTTAERDVSTGDVLIAAFAVGAPVFGTAGAAFGFIWERLRRSRRQPDHPQSRSEPPSDSEEVARTDRDGGEGARRGPGGGRRRRRRR